MCVRSSEPSAVLVNGNLHSAIVPLAKVVPSVSEVSHGRPAGPDTARPADTVTFTLQSHEALHCLDGKTGSSFRRNYVYTNCYCSNDEL